MPTELKRDAKDLKRKIELEDDNTAVQRTHMDDEYAHAGEWDPKVGGTLLFRFCISVAWVLCCTADTLAALIAAAAYSNKTARWLDSKPLVCKHETAARVLSVSSLGQPRASCKPQVPKFDAKLKMLGTRLG